MKRYLMRAVMSPFENPSYPEVFQNNLIGGNAGNLLFINSISRALLTDDAEIDYINTLYDIDDDEIERINNSYNAFIIPLANAFRATFIKELNNITNLIRRLNIPSVVIGVGIKGGKIGVERDSYSFDDAVREFCDAVLEKSKIIGIRGEMTARYLKNLGYSQEKDFTVIGCPSMYFYGETLPSPKKLNLTEKSRINLNCKASLPKKIHMYQKKICETIPDHYYIVQNLYEFETLFLGRNLLNITNRLTKTYKNYPKDYSHPLYRENRVRGFVSAKAWIDFLKQGDLSFGTRIHGNIAGILSGLPTFVVAPDSRVLELAEYHNIPHTTINELDCRKDIFHLLTNVDFSSVQSGHRERFQHYLNFLHSNGLSTVFDTPDTEQSICKFDRRIREIAYRPPITPYIYSEYDEQLEAIRVWEWLLESEKEKVENLKAEKAALKQENKDLHRDLERIRKRHSGRISLTIGSRTINLFNKT